MKKNLNFVKFNSTIFNKLHCDKYNDVILSILLSNNNIEFQNLIILIKFKSKLWMS